jgi:hypothetical protein
MKKKIGNGMLAGSAAGNGPIAPPGSYSATGPAKQFEGLNISGNGGLAGGIAGNSALAASNSNSGQNAELRWNLRLYTSDPAGLFVVKDTEKEDRYRLIKDSWEQSSPGRASKARDSRERFLNSTRSASSTYPQSAVRPISASAQTSFLSKTGNSLRSRDFLPGRVNRSVKPEPKIQNQDSINMQQELAKSAFVSFQKSAEKMKEKWKHEKQLSEDSRRRLSESLAISEKTVQNFREIDQIRRLYHRESIIKDFEAEAIALASQQQMILEAANHQAQMSQEESVTQKRNKRKP